jgi:hypothetical protein
VFMNVPPHISVTITAVTSYFMPAAFMPGKVDANLRIFHHRSSLSRIQMPCRAVLVISCV